MSAAKPSMKTTAVAALANRDQAEAAMKTIGDLQRHIIRIETELNDKVNALRAHYQTLITPQNDSIRAEFASLHAWAAANRADLLTGRGKTVKLGTGEMAWRMTPPKVSIRGADAVVEALERHRLTQYVRLKKEPHKEAILNDPEPVRDIKGISISQREEFVVKPYETDMERVEVVQ